MRKRRRQVNAALQELGELLYATHTGNPTDSEILLQKLQEVDALKAQIAGLEAQICREEAARTCPVCAAPSRRATPIAGSAAPSSEPRLPPAPFTPSAPGARSPGCLAHRRRGIMSVPTHILGTGPRF